MDEKTYALESIDRLRAENSTLLLHINYMLNSAIGHSVASLTQIQAAKKDTEKTFEHIVKAGELVRFGRRL